MMKKFLGYFEDKNLPVKRGDIVTIKKGVTIKSTHPQKKVSVAGRTYKVKVNHILNGCSESHSSEIRSNPSVRWPGTGGYWMEVDINDIPEAMEVPFDLQYVYAEGDKTTPLGFVQPINDSGLVFATSYNRNEQTCCHSLERAEKFIRGVE